MTGLQVSSIWGWALAQKFVFFRMLIFKLCLFLSFSVGGERLSGVELSLPKAVYFSSPGDSLFVGQAMMTTLHNARFARVTFWGKELLWTSRDDVDYLAFGAARDQVPGTYTLRMYFTSGDSMTKEIRVLPKDYGHWNYTQAKEKDTAEARKDDAVITLMFSTFIPSKEPYYSLPFQYPLTYVSIKEGFGVDRGLYDDGTHRYHYGIDFRPVTQGKEGDPVYAPNDGFVGHTRYHPAKQGKTVILDHGAGITASFFHLSQILVTEGQYVHKGDIIGLMGQTGNATGVNLHFSLRINGCCVDYEWFLENQHRFMIPPGEVVPKKATIKHPIPLEMPHLPRAPSVPKG